MHIIKITTIIDIWKIQILFLSDRAYSLYRLNMIFELAIVMFSSVLRRFKFNLVLTTIIHHTSKTQTIKHAVVFLRFCLTAFMRFQHCYYTIILLH